MTVYTIGSSGKGLRRFAELLRQAGVDCLVDIRLNNTSQLAGYAKRNDLEFVLELLSIAYEHHPELAPDEALLKAYREDKDWNAYVEGFGKLIAERDMVSIGHDLLSRWQRPCLLCSEDDPANCHRRLVAEHWAAHIPDVEIEHLK
jgi:uncharacterized protein (DUF488 family)